MSQVILRQLRGSIGIWVSKSVGYGNKPGRVVWPSERVVPQGATQWIPSL